MSKVISLKTLTDSKNSSSYTFFRGEWQKQNRGIAGWERRTRLDTYADVLKAVGQGSKKTRIVYKVNLGFKQAERYLNELIEHELIEVKSNSLMIRSITEQVREFLEKYDEIRNILPRQVVRKNRETGERHEKN